MRLPILLTYVPPWIAEKKEGIHSAIFWIIVLITAGFMLAALHAAHVDHFSIYPVGNGYVHWKKPLGLLQGNSSLLVLIETLIYCCLALAVGCHVLLKFSNVPGQMFGRPFLLLAGFMPGYLVLIAINRVVTFALPNRLALDMVYIIYLFITVYAYAHWRTIRRQNNERHSGRASPLNIAVACLIAAAIVGLFLINQAQTGGAHVIGDGTVFFLDIIESQKGFGRAERFPVITQHYDEIMFLYPILQSNLAAISKTIGNAINCYWILYAFGKASCFSIIAIAVYSLSNSKLLGILSASLLFFGGMHPNPLEGHLLFDSNNPLGMNLHIGRVFLSVLPIAVFAIAYNRAKILIVPQAEHIITLILIGLGVSSLSLHFVMIVPLSMAIALFLMVPVSIETGAAVIGFSLLSALTLYAVPAAAGSEVYLVSLCVLTMLLLIIDPLPHIISLCNSAALRESRLLKNSATQLIILCLSILLGLIVLGNSLVIKAYPFHLPLPIFLTRFHLDLPMGFGKNPFCGTFPMFHCAGITTFAAFYGLPFILLGISALVELRHYKAKNYPYPADSGLSMLGALAFAGTLLLLSLFAYDFMDRDSNKDWINVWLKSRLPEPWFYSCIALSLVLLWNRSAIHGKRVIVAVLLFFILAQSAMSEKARIWGQFAANFQYINLHLFALFN